MLHNIFAVKGIEFCLLTAKPHTKNYDNLYIYKRGKFREKKMRKQREKKNIILLTIKEYSTFLVSEFYYL